MVVQPEFSTRTLPALFRRRRQAYEPIGRQEADEEEHDEAALLEEDDLGQALEARGDRLMARGHRRGSTWWFVSCVRRKSSVIADDFREAALSYVLARNWRKAAAAYDSQAAYALKGGLPRDCSDAASALLNSARCYRKIVHEDEGDVAATRSALLKAAELCIDNNELQLAFTCFLVLADFCAEQQEWHNALHLFQKAKDFYGSARGSNPHYARYCNSRANLIRVALIMKNLDARA
uniref:Uncharacterized protein n=1 Tax=Avena sativa TaxID=4498 RepID=A0ACD5WFW4_AVESA